MGNKYGGFRAGSLRLCGDTLFDRNYAFYDCARHAINALVKGSDVTEIYLPNYYCKPVERYLKNNGYTINNYLINGFSDFEIPEFRPNTLLVLPNYFALTVLKDLITVALDKFGWQSANVVLDLSLAAFDFMRLDERLPYVLSPRKFLPVSEGGIIFSPYCGLESGEPINKSHIELRSLLRDPVNLQSKLGIHAYQLTEAYFSQEVRIKSLYDTAASRLKYADWEYYKTEFLEVHAKFANFDGVVGDQLNNASNCVLINRSAVRNKILRNQKKGVFQLDNGYQIFIPKYWDDVVPATAFEEYLCEDVIFVPVFWDITDSDINIIERFLYDS